MVIMAVDLGKARTGIAASDKTEYLASPVAVISEKRRDVLLSKVAEKAREIKAELIVVGLPRNMDGSEGESAVNARAFAQELTEELLTTEKTENKIYDFKHIITEGEITWQKSQ